MARRGWELGRGAASGAEPAVVRVCRAGRHPSVCGGFSLAEVLVVIAITGVLVGLIVPCLGWVLETADRMVCAANLRNLGLALHGYAKDHDGWFPVEDLCGNPQPVLVESLYGPYVCDRSVFYCPSASQIEPYAQSPDYGGPGGDSVVNTDENWERRYITYKYFSVTRRDPRMPLPLRLSEYPHLLRSDSPSPRWLMSDWVREGVPVFPHGERGGWGGGRNVLFVDTSVQFVRHRTPNAFGDEK